MTDTTFMLLAVVIITLVLVFVVKKSSKSFNTWYGDSGFLKVEKTFQMNLFNFFDLMSVFFIMQCGALIGIMVFQERDIKVILVILIPTLMIGFIPFLQFYKKYLFYQLNGNLNYTFNPIDKTLSINDENDTKFSRSEILKFEYYRMVGKIDFTFQIIQLKNGKALVFSSDLPFIGHLNEFFGDDVPSENIEFDVFESFRYLKLLKNYI
jgi:hypothetical protein